MTFVVRAYESPCSCNYLKLLKKINNLVMEGGLNKGTYNFGGCCNFVTV